MAGKGGYPNGRAETSTYSSGTKNKVKKSWVVTVVNIITKIFKIISDFLVIIYNLLVQSIKAFNFLASLIIKAVVANHTHIAVRIFVFGVVVLVTGYQWLQVGRWLFGIFGITALVGIPAAILGLTFGVCINVYQMTPLLWRISRAAAVVYSKNNINVDIDQSEIKTPQERLNNWASAVHKDTQSARTMSQWVEVGIIISHTLMTFSGLEGLALGVVALVLPERTLGQVASAMDLMALHRMESDKEYQSDDELHKDQFSF